MLLAESLVLALCGCALGIIIAVWAVSGIRGLIPSDVPGLDQIAIDWRVLTFAVAISTLAALIFGAAPAVRAAGTDAGEALRDRTLRLAGGRRVGRVRSLLVAGQLALSLGLLAGAALASQSFRALAQLAPGFDPSRVVTAKVQLSDRYADHRARAAFYRPLIERLRALPGVDGAALVLLRPLADPIGWDYPFTIEGQGTDAQARNPHANLESVSPTYFATMGIPLVDGRAFSEADGPDGGQVAIVSASMARRHWPGESPIGKRLKAGPVDSKSPWKTVVGVVGDVRYREWAAIREDIYVPYSQWNFGRMDVVIKVHCDTARPSGRCEDPLAIMPSVRAAVRAADPDMPLASVTTMARAVEEATAGPRFTAVLLGVLAVVALVVAAVGTFSVLAWSVERRTREIAVRRALGAEPRDVLHLVMRQAAGLTALGAALGVGFAWAAGRGLSGLLYSISPRDPVTLIGSVALLIVIGLGGGLLASRRAVTIDPARALREE
jgi:putative ABC transport system permease protein